MAPDETPDRHRRFAARELRGKSALYEDPAHQVAVDTQLLEFIQALPSEKRQPSTLVRDSPPREWRNGRRAGLRIRCPKGRGSSTLPSRTPSHLRILLPRLCNHLAQRAFLLTLAQRRQTLFGGWHPSEDTVATLLSGDFLDAYPGRPTREHWV